MHIKSDLIGLIRVQSSTSSANNASMDVQATQDAVRTLNESDLLGYDRQLRFSKDPKSNIGIVEVLDRTNGQVILQIPSKFVINLAESLHPAK